MNRDIFVFIISLVILIGGGYFLATQQTTDAGVIAGMLTAIGAVITYWFARQVSNNNSRPK